MYVELVLDVYVYQQCTGVLDYVDHGMSLTWSGGGLTWSDECQKMRLMVERCLYVMSLIHQ